MKALEKMDIVDAVIAERAVKFTFPNPEKISSPMISINNADVGYTEGQPILRNVYESIDNDDRIAILGANGNGKSTMMKLIADKLKVMDGTVSRSGKLRIGYFSQHQTEELDVEASPYEAMMEMMRKKGSDVKEPAVRAKLGAFGFSRDLADNRIATLSGGEKARLLFAFMSFDAPHLLLLDEPTNHLDIDAREALVQALNNYQGAVIIVSHDPNMVERVADRLWLVKDGGCERFDGDLDDYRKYTIQSRREQRKDKKGKKVKKDTSPKTDKPSASKNKQEIVKLEEKIKKLEQQKKDLEAVMITPDFYDGDSTKVTETQSKYEQTSKDIDKSEAKWLSLQEA
jgi:ATP-binding cassette subfamily F protein 3